ncbi:MAG TPA: ABC transporter permease, partial [Aestuariivirgaceae bacterium]|nr:ABC transporter permease [Aestuariivirgaceae bacterium]
MLIYAVNRLALAWAIVVVVIAVLFCMIYVIPGDPVRIALGPLATPEMAASFRAKMGLDQPVWVQFTRFFLGILQGDLGRDILSNRGVATSVLEQLPFTLTLIAGSMLWAIAIGIPLGCYGAIHRGSPVDRIIGVLSVAVIAVPSFVVA